MKLSIEAALKKFLRELANSKKDDGSWASEMINIHEAVVEEMKDSHLFVPMNVNESKAIDISTINYYFKPKSDYGKLVLTSGEEIVYKITSDDVWSYLSDKFVMIDYGGEEVPQFKKLINGYLVNMKNVKSYDSFRNEVYFKSHDSLPVAGASLKNLVPKYLGRGVDLNKSKTEYYPTKKTIFSKN